MPFLPILMWFFGPIGRYVAAALIALAAYGAWDVHIRMDEKAKVIHKQSIERQHETEKGNAARQRATRQFDAGRLRDDGFARD